MMKISRTISIDMTTWNMLLDYQKLKFQVNLSMSANELIKLGYAHFKKMVIENEEKQQSRKK